MQSKKAVDGITASKEAWKCCLDERRQRMATLDGVGKERVEVLAEDSLKDGRL